MGLLARDIRFAGKLGRASGQWADVSAFGADKSTVHAKQDRREFAAESCVFGFPRALKSYASVRLRQDLTLRVSINNCELRLGFRAQIRCRSRLAAARFASGNGTIP